MPRGRSSFRSGTPSSSAFARESRLPSKRMLRLAFSSASLSCFMTGSKDGRMSWKKHECKTLSSLRMTRLLSRRSKWPSWPRRRSRQSCEPRLLLQRRLGRCTSKRKQQRKQQSNSCKCRRTRSRSFGMRWRVRSIRCSCSKKNSTMSNKSCSFSSKCSSSGSARMEPHKNTATKSTCGRCERLLLFPEHLRARLCLPIQIRQATKSFLLEQIQ
mmetsp:Transcript_6970/g.11713  ORF Transcript_6970/g.11713 Transcript_6970/m.11713 type:complete len:214 (-) Transcript_6970:1216-1857(-)